MSVTVNKSDSLPPLEGAAVQKPLSPTQIFWYSLANLGYGAFYVLNNAVLPLFLKQYTNNNVLLGLMGSTHSIEGAVIQPIVGSASDRLRSPLGRRRPFMLVSVPLSALFLIVTILLPRLKTMPMPFGVLLGAMVVAIFLFTVLFNIAWDPYQALMPDITPEAQRGRVMAISTLFGVVGQAGLMLLDWPLTVKFVLVAGVMLTTTLLTCVMIKEPPATGSAPSRNHYREMAEAIKGLKTLRQAGRSLVTLFFSGVGIGAVLPFLTLFVKEITKCTDQQAQQMFLVLMSATAVGVLPCGWITDKVGPKRVLLVGLGLIAVACFAALWVTTLTQIAVVLAVAGLGNAAQSAAIYPLLTELVPSEEVGFYTGLQSTALSIAAPVTSVITGELINRGSYRVIFGVCAVSVLIAIAALVTVHLHIAAREIAARNREQGREA